MKKIISTTIAVILVMSCFVMTVFAESNVSLLDDLGGIKLGDTSTTMKEKLPKLHEMDKSKSDSDSCDFYYSGTVAGISHSGVSFYLDRNGELTDVLYNFYDSTADGWDLEMSMDIAANGDGGLHKEFYDELKNSLTETYGVPVDMPDTTVMLIYGRAYDQVLNGEEAFVEKTEWLVQDNNEMYVKIDLLLTCEYDRSDIQSLYLSYKSTTSEEVDAIKN